MKFGISTASLLNRAYTEDALPIIKSLGADTAEVFLESFSEYTKEFGQILLKQKDGLDIHSFHTLNTHFEPMLYSVNVRAKEDAFKILNDVLFVAKTIGAKYYTFHGVARLKKGFTRTNYPDAAIKTQTIIDICEKYGVTLTYENVEWAYYSYPGFFKEMKKLCPKLCGVLDIKQAERSGFSYREYVEDMNESIKTVHLSDYNDNGNMCLPGKGLFDFSTLFSILKDNGFDGGVMIECYKEDYADVSELKQSLSYIRELAYKIF